MYIRSHAFWIITVYHVFVQVRYLYDQAFSRGYVNVCTCFLAFDMELEMGETYVY